MAGNTPLSNELIRTGHMLARWRAQFSASLWAGGILLCLGVSSLSDVFLQYQKPGRVAAWLLLVALAGLALWQIARMLRQRHTVQGVAATVERAFPELDNRLINFIQFSANPMGDAFRMAYVKRGCPEWRSLKLSRMKNRKAHIRAFAFLSISALLIAAPLAFTTAGRTWITAVWRIVNPFSNVPPISLTNLVAIEPGDVTIRQGESIVMTCEVDGYKGHKVWLDVKPSDGNRTTFVLGKLTGIAITSFPHRRTKGTADF